MTQGGFTIQLLAPLLQQLGLGEGVPAHTKGVGSR